VGQWAVKKAAGRRGGTPPIAKILTSCSPGISLIDQEKFPVTL
jgi:hypothetical protein